MFKFKFISLDFKYDLFNLICIGCRLDKFFIYKNSKLSCAEVDPNGLKVHSSQVGSKVELS